MKRVLFSLFGFFLVILVLILDESLLKQNVWLIYLSLLLGIIVYGSNFKNLNYFFFSPSFLTSFYVLFSFALGSFSLSRGILINKSQSYHFLKFQHLKTATLIYVISFVIIILCLELDKRDYFRIKKKEAQEKDKSFRTTRQLNVKRILFFSLLLLFFTFVDFDLSALGGVGSFSTIPRTIGVIGIVTELAWSKNRFRLFFYVFIIAAFAATNFNSKREVVFLVIPILFLESQFGNVFFFKKFLKKSALLVIIGLIGSYLIILMSIARGYGSYKINSFSDTQKHFADFVSKDTFIDFFVSVTEAPTTYYNSTNAIEMVINNNALITSGSTIYKVLFIFVPRSIYPSKPSSMITIYTKLENPSFYAIGGSLPINLVSESFWNFYYLWFIFIFIFFKIANNVYKKLFMSTFLNRHSLVLLFAYTYFITYVRGSGLDMYLVYIVIAYIFQRIFTSMYKRQLDMRVKKVALRAYPG
jgi:hypothetical protein